MEKKRKIINLIIDRHDGLFYLACLLVTFEIFPFHNYGLGSGKSLSVIPCVLYFLKSLFINRLLVTKDFRIELVCISILLLISFLKDLFVYDDFVGISVSLSMWGIYIIYYFCFQTFMFKAEKDKIINMFRCIFASFKISLFFGLLELLYFHVASFSFLKSFISLFVRDSMYLEVGRLQFNFGEPSSCGVLIAGLLSLTVYSLFKLGYSFTKNEKIEIILIFIGAAIFAKSVMFWAIFATMIVSFFVFSDKKYSLKKISLAVVFLIIAAISFSVASESNVFTRIERLTQMQSNSSFEEDNSSATRFALWYISYEMLKDNYVLGIGWGNFALEYPHYYKSLPAYMGTMELANKLKNKTHQSYSIFSTALAEGGIVGVIWLLLFFKRLWPDTKYKKLFIFVYILFCFQVIIIYKFECLLIAFILADERINRFISLSNKRFKRKSNNEYPSYKCSYNLL